MMKVYNMKSARSGRPVANQFMIQVGNILYFQSYESVVCVIDKNVHTVTFGRNWDFSVTTLKYLVQFLSENGIHLPDGKSRSSAIRKGIEQGLFVFDPSID